MEKSIVPTMKNINKHITVLLNNAITKAFGQTYLTNFEAVVSWSSTSTSDLSSPSALKIYNMCCKKEGFNYPSSKEVAEKIIENLEKDDIIKDVKISTMILADANKKPAKKEKEVKENKENAETKEKKEKKVAPPSYFIDIFLNDDYLLNTSINILQNGIVLDTSSFPWKNVLVDFSSPNIAKEMHVGHLRSTIIGESVCRILEFLNFNVDRINHVGDWGTQFGMLISNLKEVHPDYLTNQPDLKDLEKFYVESKKKFDTNEDFKKRAYENTVLLQTGNEECREAWKFICQASRNEFEKIYQKLDIKLKEVGESFYDPLSRELIPRLEKEGHVFIDNGAKIMKLDGFKVPLMVVKSDGGYTYDTSDLCAVLYRLEQLNKDWLIYVVGGEQSDHFKAIFQAAKQLGSHNPPKTRIDHMGFGMMLNETGGKISTREGGLVKLGDLLDMAKEESKNEMIKRAKEHNVDLSEEEIESSSAKIGYSAVRYFDLKQTRENNYKFSYSLMLDPKGNTAVYLFYMYARICSVLRKANYGQKEIDELIKTEKIIITHEKERALIISILKFNETLDDTLSHLALNKLADYVYNLSSKFSEFFDECRIKDSEHMKSRLLIVELTKRFLEKGFYLLGLTPVERI